MYKISVPIRNVTVTKENRGEYLKILKDAQIDRLFLTRSDYCSNEEEELEMIENFRDNLNFFRDGGLEVGVWLGNTTGHGVVLVGMNEQEALKGLTRIRNIKGEDLPETQCPLDPNMRRVVSHFIASIAKTGTKTILLDDDFRMSHGAEHCCACDFHMKRMEELCGEKLELAELERLVFQSPANKYRKAWLEAQREGLIMLAKEIRAAVDEVDPTVRIALCSSLGLWDWDNCNPLDLAKELSGGQKPLVRLLTAPYSAMNGNKKIPAMLERARMFSAMAADQGVELMSEGDVYPRPRHLVPASYLEIFDGVLRADGIFDGMLKYMADYNATPSYEMGYFDRHTENLPLMREISAMFAGKEACGVRTVEFPHLLGEVDLSLSLDSQYYPYPLAAMSLAFCSIPTTHEKGGICNAIFGDTARRVTDKDLEKGALLDALSAILLSQRGVDVGLEKAGDFQQGMVDFLSPADRSEQTNIAAGRVRYLKPTLKAGAEVVLLGKMGMDYVPISYRYENADGQRFYVLLYDTLGCSGDSGLARGHLAQKIMMEQVEWVARETIPVKCTGHPDLYVICKEKDGKMAVGLFNCYADSILHPVIKLSKSYKNVRFLNTNGTLNGDTVTLDRPIPAFEFVAFEVEI